MGGKERIVGKSGKRRWIDLLLLTALATPAFPLKAYPETESTQPHEIRVAEPGTAVRGHMWLGEGVASLHSSHANYLGNRFQLGLEMHLGKDYRYLLGWTLIDSLSTGESSSQVGSIARESMDFSLGYFLIPDKLWLKYSYMIHDVSGSQVVGSHTTHGHGPALGLRFFDSSTVKLGVEIGYAHISRRTVATYDLLTNTVGSSNYPRADLFSLSLLVGIDIGGRQPLKLGL